MSVLMFLQPFPQTKLSWSQSFLLEEQKVQLGFTEHANFRAERDLSSSFTAAWKTTPKCNSVKKPLLHDSPGSYGPRIHRAQQEWSVSAARCWRPLQTVCQSFEAGVIQRLLCSYIWCSGSYDSKAGYSWNFQSEHLSMASPSGQLVLPHRMEALGQLDFLHGCSSSSE